MKVKSTTSCGVYLPRLTKLPTGAVTVTRVAKMRDYSAVQRMHSRCSAESRTIRYFTPTSGLSTRGWHDLCDQGRGLTLITTPRADTRKVIAMTNVLHTYEDGVVEFAVLVEDAWQSRGLGSALASYALESVRTQGARALTASVMAVNGRAMRMLRRIGATTSSPPGSEVDFRVDIDI
ncbi:N-acetyltransferase family protein [Kitasatospora sp. McL0602]|uniref:GNAT family N-acetyltransferase n=1 Tax=Kitasatospora sp. McL0602 TaxID=3439530 RepID=UPI003F89D76F